MYGRYSKKDAKSDLRIIGVFALGILIIGSTIWGLWAALAPATQEIKRNAVVESQAYIDSLVGELRSDMVRYAKLETDKLKFASQPEVVTSLIAQQQATINKMWDSYDKLSAGGKDVIQKDHKDIYTFLQNHQPTE